jgi:hypothetical protein
VTWQLLLVFAQTGWGLRSPALAETLRTQCLFNSTVLETLFDLNDFAQIKGFVISRQGARHVKIVCVLL